jgi:hypothetical protein
MPPKEAVRVRLVACVWQTDRVTSGLIIIGRRVGTQELMVNEH